jgi:hypothetical protein
MKPAPHLLQVFGRLENPAVREFESSRFPQFGQMKKGTERKSSDRTPRVRG